jgi:hypothetical protein
VPIERALLLVLSFVRPRRRLSSAPTTDFRRRRAQETVKVGRRSAQEDLSDASRPRLDSPEHGGSIDRSGQLAATAPTISTRRFDNFKPLVFDQFHAAGERRGRNLVLCGLFDDRSRQVRARDVASVLWVRTGFLIQGIAPEPACSHLSGQGGPPKEAANHAREGPDRNRSRFTHRSVHVPISAARVSALPRQQPCLVSWGGPCLLGGPFIQRWPVDDRDTVKSFATW